MYKNFHYNFCIETSTLDQTFDSQNFTLHIPIFTKLFWIQFIFDVIKILNKYCVLIILSSILIYNFKNYVLLCDPIWVNQYHDSVSQSLSTREFDLFCTSTHRLYFDKVYSHQAVLLDHKVQICTTVEVQRPKYASRSKSDEIEWSKYRACRIWQNVFQFYFHFEW